jgi:hypothetical protein
MARIRKIADEMRRLQEQKNEALRMKLRGEVDARTFREVTAEIDAAHDQLARAHKRLASEAAMPEPPDPSLAWEDLSAEDRRAGPSETTSASSPGVWKPASMSRDLQRHLPNTRTIGRRHRPAHCASGSHDDAANWRGAGVREAVVVPIASQ